MRRTNVDFSNHIHTVEVYKNGDKEIQIDHFAEPGTCIYAIHFMNSPSGLVVYGDCGSWMFCRNFYPSGENGVSDGYWVEKLRLDTCQEPYHYDSEETASEIEKLIGSGLEEYGYNGERLTEAKEWFGELLQETDDEIGYIYKAYRDYGKPSFIDYEEIPFCKKLDAGLKCVFDAFDIMCERMNSEFDLPSWVSVKDVRLAFLKEPNQIKYIKKFDTYDPEISESDNSVAFLRKMEKENRLGGLWHDLVESENVYIKKQSIIHKLKNFGFSKMDVNSYADDNGLSFVFDQYGPYDLADQNGTILVSTNNVGEIFEKIKEIRKNYSSYKERYKRISKQKWFKDAYCGRSIGDVIEIDE